jgi:hypothetical protein
MDNVQNWQLNVCIIQKTVLPAVLSLKHFICCYEPSVCSRFRDTESTQTTHFIAFLNIFGEKSASSLYLNISVCSVRKMFTKHCLSKYTECGKRTSFSYEYTHIKRKLVCRTLYFRLCAGLSGISFWISSFVRNENPGAAILILNVRWDRLSGLVSDFLATDPEVRVRFPALLYFLRIAGSGTGSTQPREYNWGATW